MDIQQFLLIFLSLVTFGGLLLIGLSGIAWLLWKRYRTQAIGWLRQQMAPSPTRVSTPVPTYGAPGPWGHPPQQHPGTSQPIRVSGPAKVIKRDKAGKAVWPGADVLRNDTADASEMSLQDLGRLHVDLNANRQRQDDMVVVAKDGPHKMRYARKAPGDKRYEQLISLCQAHEEMTLRRAKQLGCLPFEDPRASLASDRRNGARVRS